VGTMKKMLILLLLAGVLASGCIQTAATPELKYVDPENPNNYILLKEDPTHPGTGTFSIITTEYVAGGTYTSTSKTYSLQYADYPVGVTLEKVGSGVRLSDTVIWSLL
jgi:hypothetical protein